MTFILIICLPFRKSSFRAESDFSTLDGTCFAMPERKHVLLRMNALNSDRRNETVIQMSFEITKPSNPSHSLFLVSMAHRLKYSCTIDVIGVKCNYQANGTCEVPVTSSSSQVPRSVSLSKPWNFGTLKD
jgi:hypothetical protein